MNRDEVVQRVEAAAAIYERHLEQALKDADREVRTALQELGREDVPGAMIAALLATARVHREMFRVVTTHPDVVHLASSDVGDLVPAPSSKDTPRPGPGCGTGDKPN
jgi:hypothetical protein